MLETFVRHGDLTITCGKDGSIQIVRESTGHAILLSLSEWEYLLIVMRLHGWPIAPPTETTSGLSQ